MSDLIKKIKIKKQDGTYTDYISIGAEAKNVDVSDGESVEYKLNKKPYYYNSIVDMKADTKLKVGDMAITLGYYEPNDGGNGEYRIVSGTYADDEGSYHQLDNNLFAELIIKDNINVKQFGAYGDNTHDDTIFIQNALNCAVKLNKKTLFIPVGIYCISSSLDMVSDFYHINIIGENTRNTILKSISNENIDILKIRGGSGQDCHNYIKDLTFLGVDDNKTHNMTTNGIHVLGQNGLRIINCFFTKMKYAILLDNTGNNFTEYIIAEDCHFSNYYNCMRLQRSGTQWSFHGCGLKFCNIQESQYSSNVLYIDSGCQLYNGSLDFYIWTNSSNQITDSFVYLNGDTSKIVQTREMYVTGNIKYEGSVKRFLFDGVNIESILWSGNLFGIGQPMVYLAKNSNFSTIHNVDWAGLKNDGAPIVSLTKPRVFYQSVGATEGLTVKPFSFISHGAYIAVVKLQTANATVTDKMELYRVDQPQTFYIKNQERIQNFNAAGLHTENITYTLDSGGLHITLVGAEDRNWNVTITFTPIDNTSYIQYFA